MVPGGNNAGKTEQLGSAEGLGTLAAAYSCVCASLCSCTLHKPPCGGGRQGGLLLAFFSFHKKASTLKNVRSGPDHVE